jgi:hypothetical protein
VVPSWAGQLTAAGQQAAGERGHGRTPCLGWRRGGGPPVTGTIYAVTEVTGTAWVPAGEWAAAVTRDQQADAFDRWSAPDPAYSVAAAGLLAALREQGTYVQEPDYRPPVPRTWPAGRGPGPVVGAGRGPQQFPWSGSTRRRRRRRAERHDGARRWPPGPCARSGAPQDRRGRVMATAARSKTEDHHVPPGRPGPGPVRGLAGRAVPRQRGVRVSPRPGDRRRPGRQSRCPRRRGLGTIQRAQLALAFHPVR